MRALEPGGLGVTEHHVSTYSHQVRLKNPNKKSKCRVLLDFVSFVSDVD